MTTIKNRYAELLAAVAEREARMVRMRGIGMTMEAIAAAEGIPKQTVSVILARVKRREAKAKDSDASQAG